MDLAHAQNCGLMVGQSDRHPSVYKDVWGLFHSPQLLLYSRKCVRQSKEYCEQSLANKYTCRCTFSIMYTLFYYRRNAAPTANPVSFFSEETIVDLSTKTQLTPNFAYNIYVFAMNGIGESNSSNLVEYTRMQGLLRTSIHHPEC